MAPEVSLDIFRAGGPEVALIAHGAAPCRGYPVAINIGGPTDGTF